MVGLIVRCVWLPTDVMAWLAGFWPDNGVQRCHLLLQRRRLSVRDQLVARQAGG